MITREGPAGEAAPREDGPHRSGSAGGDTRTSSLAGDATSTSQEPDPGDRTPATPHRTLAGGAQRSPRPHELVAALGSVARSLPGMALTTWRYLRHRPSVRHELIECEGSPDAPDPDRPLPGDPATLLRRSAGRGPLYRRQYRVEVRDARLGPEELVTRLLVDPNRAAPTEVSVFEPVRGHGRRPGAEMAVRMPGPWDAPVRVVERTPTSFRFATLRGHMEAGEISFTAEWQDSLLVFTIESWARSGDRLYDLLYSRLPLTREMQLHMWVHVCEQVAAMSGGTPVDGVAVTTWRWKDLEGTRG